MSSKFMNVNWHDVVNGFASAIVAAVLISLKQIIESHGFNFNMADLEEIVKVAVTTGVAYLSTIFFQNSKGVLGAREK